MRLGIYIGGTPNKQIDCRHIIENGNPGIGGTEYEFVMLSIYLGQYNIHSDIDLTIFQTGRYTLPDQIISINGVHPADMLNEATTHGIDLLIIDSRWPLNLIKNLIQLSGIKVIVWCHCVGSLYRHLLFSQWDAIRKVVFVSRGHYLNYIDNPIINKSSFVFNAVSVNDNIHRNRENMPFNIRPHDAVFMGALDESKGFHVLAKAWPEVLRLVPDARLHVIGSANLYGGRFKIGPLGIAAENYEKKFGKYLSTENGLLHPSVILHGQLGKEKYEIMTKCRVGIPNPDGNTETFCICAVEMQLCGCKVVTKWSSGYIDTVPFPNIMVSRTKDLASAIASSLVEDNFDCTSNLWNIRTHFSINTFGNKWMKIIHSVYEDSEFSENITIPAQFKSRKINASIRKFLPFIPPIGLLSDTLYRFVVVLKRNIFH